MLGCLDALFSFDTFLKNPNILTYFAASDVIGRGLWKLLPAKGQRKE